MSEITRVHLDYTGFSSWQSFLFFNLLGVIESAFANVGCCRLAASDCHIIDYIVL